MDALLKASEIFVNYGGRLDSHTLKDIFNLKRSYWDAPGMIDYRQRYLEIIDPLLNVSVQ